MRSRHARIGHLESLEPRTLLAADGIWISHDQIMRLPTSGPAWESVLAASRRDTDSPDIANQDDKTDTNTLAKALVGVRLGDAALQREVRETVMAAIDTEDGGRTLALGRNLAPYVIAADIVQLDANDDAQFRDWLRETLGESLSGRTLRSTHEDRPNNWGTMAGGSRAAVAAYLGDNAELQRTAEVFKGWLGDRASYDQFDYGDLSWQADPSRPVGINPVGATKDGRSIDGAIPDDMRRGGSFQWPPSETGYPWEALQGAVVQAELLHRAGYDAWQWEDQALLRAVEFLDELGWDETGDDEWIAYLVDSRYGTRFADDPDNSAGKIMGWTSWTHAEADVERPPTPTNQAPSVEAGLDAVISVGQTVRLDGTVDDDGLPDPPSDLSTQWTVVAGPGLVDIADPTAVETDATFSTAGTYVLRLSADDGERIGSDQLTVTVELPLPPVEPPVEPPTDDDSDLYAFTPQEFGQVSLRPFMGLNGVGRNIDTLAFWEADDPAESLLFVSAKRNDLVEVWQGPHESPRELPPLRHATLGNRVNGVYVDPQTDLLYVSGGNGTSVFQLPEMRFVTTIDAGRGEANSAILNRPDGAKWLYTTQDRNIVIHNAETGEQLGSFRPPHGTVEALVADDFHQRLYVPDENDRGGVYVFDPQGRLLTTFGQGDFQDDGEGLALWKHLDAEGQDTGHGLIIVSDQRDSLTDFEVYDRATLAHLGVIHLEGVNNTDGLAIVQQPSPQHPLGLLAAVDDDRRVVLVDLQQLLVTAGLIQPHEDDSPDTPPTVDAGPDATIDTRQLQLDATVGDDGPLGELTLRWTVVSGPADVEFADRTSATTTASFSAPGVYVLRLTADDGQHTVADDLEVTVGEQAFTTDDDSDALRSRLRRQFAALFPRIFG